MAFVRLPRHQEDPPELHVCAQALRRELNSLAEIAVRRLEIALLQRDHTEHLIRVHELRVDLHCVLELQLSFHVVAFLVVRFALL